MYTGEEKILKCADCWIEQPTELFYRSVAGYTSRCKKCHNIQSSRYRNREKNGIPPGRIYKKKDRFIDLDNRVADCTNCGKRKKFSDFLIRQSTGTPRSYCRECGVIISMRYSAERKSAGGCVKCGCMRKGNSHYCEKCRIVAAASQRRRRSDSKSLLIEIMGGECNICGFKSGCKAVFDFHHKDKASKKFSIASKAMGRIDRLIEEASKCILVCANCHRILHQKYMDRE